MEDNYAVGVPWYQKEEYDYLRKLLGEPDSMPATYEEWLIKVNEVIKRGENMGWKMIKAPIHPDEIIAWCRSKELVLDYKSQNFYASQFAGRQLYDLN